VGLPKLLQRLYRYATGTLHLARIDAERAGSIEAFDLIQALYEKGLSGELTWDLPDDATDDEIIGAACLKMYGMRSTLLRKTALTIGDDEALDEQADPAPDALALLIERGAIEDLMRALEHDAEASAHAARMFESWTRAEIEADLGCDRPRSDAVHKRIMRVAATLCATMRDESEDEPPSSGPRGTNHAPQAAEERQGEAPEPHRGAGRAHGRR